MNDAESEAAVRAERLRLLERRQAGERAAAEATVSGRLRRAVKAMRQPYEQICQATGIPFEQLADFMAGGCYGINWPDIDEDLSAERLLRGAAQASNSVAMRIPGKRVKRTRSTQTVQLIVAVGTETVIPPSDAAEPCLDSATVEVLRDVHQRAKAGDIAWLQERGKVYQLIEATS